MTPEELSLFVGQLSGRKPSLLLSGEGGRWGRYSYLACDPLYKMQTQGREFLLSNYERNEKWPFIDLQKFFDNEISAQKGIDAGGWIGFFSYESGYVFDRFCPFDNAKGEFPDFALYYYPWILEFDHASESVRLLGKTRLNHCGDGLDSVFNLLKDFAAAPVDVSTFTLDESDFDLKWEPWVTKKYYLNAVERILEYIAAGDIYQANYTMQLKRKFGGSPQDLFAVLSKINPATFAAYLDFENFQIISASPELFLQSDGKNIVTRPIKGTRRKCLDAKKNEAMRRELARSGKDNAEHVMIVDLERNDLGRVCRYGSVKVSQLAELEALPSLYHLTSTVEGGLIHNLNFMEILGATFPGGSITGAPKIRAMEIIDELEPERRSVYTGSIGMLRADGTINLSIAIRTMTLCDGHLSMGVGGGIVADSQPELEWKECMDKGRNLARAVDIAEGRGAKS